MKKILGIVVLLSLLLGLVPASAMAAVATPQPAAPAISAPTAVATPPAPTPWPGGGTTREVWPDEISIPLEFEGAAYTSIQAAIDAADAGDTVLVHPGTYDEFINIDKSLQVISETGAADTIIYPLAPPVETPTAGVSDIGEVQGEVVLISSTGVVFGGSDESGNYGFTVRINGYCDSENLLPDTGIAVATMEEVSVGDTTTPTESLPEVQISANAVNIDNIDQAYGIYSAAYDGAVYIGGNTVLIGAELLGGIGGDGGNGGNGGAGLIEESGVGFAAGVTAGGNSSATITANTIDLTTNLAGATAIEVYDCPVALAGSNTIDIYSAWTGEEGGSSDVTGINFGECAEVTALVNTIELASDGSATGISGTPLLLADIGLLGADITGNEITINTGEGRGIAFDYYTNLTLMGNIVGITAITAGAGILANGAMVTVDVPILPDEGTAVLGDNQVTVSGGAVDGIWVEGYESVAIADNIVTVNAGIEDADGIIVSYAAVAQVTQNQITATAQLAGPAFSGMLIAATGIVFDLDTDSRAAGNTVTVSAGPAAEVIPLQGKLYAVGIYFDGWGITQASANTIDVRSDWFRAFAAGINFGDNLADPVTSGDGDSEAWADGNIISVTANGERYSIADGIDIWSYDRVLAEGNSVTTESTARKAETWGIYFDEAYMVQVADNDLTLESVGERKAWLFGVDGYDFYSFEAWGNTLSLVCVAESATEIFSDEEEDEATELLHQLPAGTAGLEADIIGPAEAERVHAQTEAYGISAEYGYSADISGNEVEMNVMTGLFAEGWKGIARGRTWAEGIEVMGCDTLDVSGNLVYCAADLFAGAGGEKKARAEGYSVAGGIVLTENGGGQVAGNEVSARGYTDAETLAGLMDGWLLEMSPLMTDIQEGVLANVGEMSGQLAEQVSGNVRLEAIRAEGTLRALGFGIVARYTPGISIVDNPAIGGMGRTNVIVLALEEIIEDSSLVAEGEALAMGFGAGIWLRDCPGAQIADNGEGEAGPAEVLPDAAQMKDAAFTDNAEQQRFNPGVSGRGYADAEVVAGVLVSDEVAAALSTARGFSFGVLALGGELAEAADEVETPVLFTASNNNVYSAGIAVSYLGAITTVPEDLAVAEAVNLGLSLGVTALLPRAYISGNAVVAGNRVGIFIQSIGVDGATLVNLAAGGSIAIGTLTAGEGSQILDNSLLRGDALAYIETASEEGSLLQDAQSMGEGLSIGVGLLAIGSDTVISGNNVQGITFTIVELDAYSESPLEVVFTEAVGVGFSSGLIVMAGEGIQVTHNTLAADIGLGLIWSTGATFIENSGALIGARFDTLLVAAQADVNYNDIITLQSDLEDADISVVIYDFGLYSILSEVNARYNWWGDVSGPSWVGNGNGTAIGWTASSDIPFSWWLSHPQADLVADNVGYYAFEQPLAQGWNTLSAPMALEVSRWGDIVALNDLDYSIAYYYDPAQVYPWVQITDNDQMVPLNAAYIKMNTPGAIIFTTSADFSVPSRYLGRSQSWYLIGTAPYDENFPFTTGMPVYQSLTSIEETPGGLVGYDQVLSPSLGGQAPWAYTINDWWDGPDMIPGKGYWVFMENPDVLAGFCTTPLPATLPIWAPWELDN